MCRSRFPPLVHPVIASVPEFPESFQIGPFQAAPVRAEEQERIDGIAVLVVYLVVEMRRIGPPRAPDLSYECTRGQGRAGNHSGRGLPEMEEHLAVAAAHAD